MRRATSPRRSTTTRVATLACALLAPVLAAAPSFAASRSFARSPHAAVAFPKATGTFGQSPTITYPSSNPPTTLQSKVLVSGKGSVVHKGDLLVANYLGQIWKGKTFDSSYTRKFPIGVPIGVKQVIAGWDKVLVGARVGSRILMVVPPADGYGKAGSPSAGIKATDTLVFVVDVLANYPSGDKLTGTAAFVAKSANGVTVVGNVGVKPTITVAKSAVQPKKEIVQLLDRGTGPLVAPGLVVVDFALANWTGVVQESTWTTGTPYGATIGLTGQSSLLDSLVGFHVGSRLLLETPKNSSGGPFAVVVDLLAQTPTEKLGK